MLRPGMVHHRSHHGIMACDRIHPVEIQMTNSFFKVLPFLLMLYEWFRLVLSSLLSQLWPRTLNILVMVHLPGIFGKTFQCLVAAPVLSVSPASIKFIVSLHLQNYFSPLRRLISSSCNLSSYFYFLWFDFGDIVSEMCQVVVMKPYWLWLCCSGRIPSLSLIRHSFMLGWLRHLLPHHSQGSSRERQSRNTMRLVTARAFYVIRGVLTSPFILNNSVETAAPFNVVTYPRCCEPIN